ncbi:MAG: alpha-1,2-fucosyltransferase [Paludibacter sp.]
MIILVDSYGNHFNTLFQNMHLELFCEETNHRLINLGQLDDFDNLYETNTFMPRIIRKFLSTLTTIFIRTRLIKVKHFDDINESFESVITRLGNKRLHYIDGWGIRMNQLTEKAETHQIYANRFALRDEFFENNELYKQIHQTKEQNKKVVGIHIRRGDYVNYLDGKYFFSISSYLDLINQMKILIQKLYKADTVFVIFSTDDFSELASEQLLVSTNDWYIDQKLMTCCDYLIGPPSTFTGWASYTGNVPLYHIEDVNHNVQLHDFFIMND